MVISLDIIIPIIVGALISIIMNSNKVTNKILTISARLANAYYNKKKEKLSLKATDDPFELLSLSNETYKIEYVKKPQLISVIYLVIYNAILIIVTVLMYLLHYNLLLYILSGFITNILIIFVIKIKQKIKSRGGNRQQRVT
jgi:ABC-type multidrug transport system fused ATPase/permease subunit